MKRFIAPLVLASVFLSTASAQTSKVDVWSCVDQGRRDYTLHVIPENRGAGVYELTLALNGTYFLPVKSAVVSDAQVYFEDRTTVLRRKFFGNDFKADYSIFLDGRILRRQPGRLSFTNHRTRGKVVLDCRIAGSQG